MVRARHPWINIRLDKFSNTWPVGWSFGLLLAICAYAFSGCATTDDPYHGLDRKSRYYRVKQGDTLYGISKRTGRESRLIAEWNGISAPFRIVEGQMIRLFPAPQSASTKAAKEPIIQKTATETVKGTNTGDSRSIKKASEPIKTKQTVKKAGAVLVAPIKKQSEPIEKSFEKKLKVFWQWPLKGVIAKNYSQTGRKGLDIAGKYGEAVRAAADGRIVYCGQGLIGYGNLVIVKHDTHFLSAYGNNSRLLVREGETVKTGQRIAEVGMGKDKQPVLHFEIRKDGKPVDPIQHLPKP
ncbi:MAG: peptidoglycan DD-metalloendopeptidase family protein [Methylococcaceae bacterium]|nr:peptidoglycan DD-metalloendopeptidase family protein [Methylococcaceae bacterium]MCI0733552.1 peptidoglycan DD-metalloendopeptidase family protein [Methylococcaceae bacterium]